MRTNHFKSLVQSTWAYWQQHIDRFPEIDWEETQESMTILMPDGRKYLFNRHTGMQQLWMASPISGGRHFSMMTQGVGSETIADGQADGQCVRPPFIAHTGSDEVNQTDYPRASGCPAYWTDTRNGEIIESVMNTELASHWNIALDLQPFQAVMDEAAHPLCNPA